MTTLLTAVLWFFVGAIYGRALIHVVVFIGDAIQCATHRRSDDA